MKDPAKEWLPPRLTIAGGLAGGLRRPNGKLAVQCADANCPPVAMENLLRQFDGVRALLATEKPAPKWVTFSFELGQIRYVPRADGWLLALVVRPETEAAQALDKVSEEFIALPLTK